MAHRELEPLLLLGCKAGFAIIPYSSMISHNFPQFSLYRGRWSPIQHINLVSYIYIYPSTKQMKKKPSAPCWLVTCYVPLVPPPIVHSTSLYPYSITMLVAKSPFRSMILRAKPPYGQATRISHHTNRSHILGHSISITSCIPLNPTGYPTRIPTYPYYTKG